MRSCIGIPKFDGHCQRFPSHFIVDPLSEGGGGGGGYTDLPLCASLSACPQQFFDAFFSETITRNMLEILKACLMMGFIS